MKSLNVNEYGICVFCTISLTTRKEYKGFKHEHVFSLFSTHTLLKNGYDVLTLKTIAKFGVFLRIPFQTYFFNTLHDSSLENHTLFQTKMGKIYTRLISDQNPKTLPDVAAHIYRVARNFCGF